MHPRRYRTAICGAESSNGIDWSPSPDSGSPRGLLVRGVPGTAEASVEGCASVKRGAETWLYYSGYPENGNPVSGFPATLRRATSTDGRSFTRTGPVLAPRPGGYDGDAVYSPAILDRGGLLEMVYTGHCYTNCTETAGVRLLGATSSDGINWTRIETPLLEPGDGGSWTASGIAEASLFVHDGQLAMLFTGGLEEGERHKIGLARAASLAGPWTAERDPVLLPSSGGFDSRGILAPSVLSDAGNVRAWLTGVDGAGAFTVGYAESMDPFAEQ